MRIDLKTESLFDVDEIIFDKSRAFIFGQNGTGKSTITKLIKEQVSDYDVKIFQGFEGVIGENNKLNAVVLGKENIEISKKINEMNQKKNEEQKKADKIRKNIIESSDNSTNLYSKYKEFGKKFNAISKKIDNFYSQSASKIKAEFPSIIEPGSRYDKRDFIGEITKGEILSSSDIIMYKNIINSEIKVATMIEIEKVNSKKLMKEVNDLLKSKVEEKVHISRFDGDNNKKIFAQEGLKIHKVGDICAFCGNRITEDKYIELENYFSVDEVKEMQNKIDKLVVQVEKHKKSIIEISINYKNFYSNFENIAKEIELLFHNDKQKVINCLELCLKSLSEKSKNLFSGSEELNTENFSDLYNTVDKYNEIVKFNNSNDLLASQKEARKKLRYNEIYLLKEKFKYQEHNKEFERVKEKFEEFKKLISYENEKIENINRDIKNIEHEITNLQGKTISEELLAEIVNKKLRDMVSFELIHCPSTKEKGCYKVKCKKTGETRNVTKLSTGEKNIIAFLYFIQKLNEVDQNNNDKKNKVVVFDDPMNSNDDIMQYIIMNELKQLYKSMQKNENNKFILLTHNKHFYINITYREIYKNTTKQKCKSDFYRFVDNCGLTKVIKITQEKDDFKTSYDSLWKELEILYKFEGDKPDMLLNPIRRILETYINFNNIDINDFYKNKLAYKKLFDVNSHSIDDLQADLNGNNKKQVIAMLKRCFNENNAIEHFNHHWKVVE